MTTQNTTKRDVDTAKFSEVAREDFIRGWEAAGGYMRDLDSPTPWCCPWTHGNTVITAIGDTPEDWGSAYWAQCRGEVKRLIAEEEIRSEA